MGGSTRGPATWGPIALAVVVAACTGGGGGAPGSDRAVNPPDATDPPVVAVSESVVEEPVVEPLAIALVTPRAADGSATGDIAEALDRLDPPAEVSLRADIAVDEATDTLRELAEGGADLVIAHGTELAPAVREVAAAYPDVAFAYGLGRDTFDLPNVFVYDARADEGGYVLGAMAAVASGSGVVGVIGSVEVADVRRYVEGFVAGAATTRPAVSVETTWVDSFDDADLAAEAARRLADRGADVLTATSQASAGALAVAIERQIGWFDSQADESGRAPDLVVASQVYRWEVVIEEILARRADGEPGGTRVVLDLANGGLEVVVHDGALVTAEVRAVAEAAIAGLLDGSLDTGVD